MYILNIYMLYKLFKFYNRNIMVLTHGKFTINGNTAKGNKRIPYFRYFPNPTPVEVILPISAPS